MKQLPTRPEAHVKDTRGLKRLLNFFRDEWIIREIKPDYGIDFEIEPFKNSKPLNKIVKIQLKNHETFNDFSEAINILSMKVSTLNYLYETDNTYLITLTNDNMFCSQIKSLYNTFNINQEKKNCSIPLVYRRPFRSQQYSKWVEYPKFRIIFNLLGNELAHFELDKTKDSFENYYSLTIKDNEEKYFFEREDLANFGYYYSTLKKGQKKAKIKLLEKLSEANSLQRRGVIEGLAYLNYKDDVTEQIALEMIASDNTQDILVGLMHLSIPGENKHLDIYLNAIYGYFNNRKCILFDEEIHGIELTSIEALYNISTAESLGLIVEMFCSDIFKPTEVSLIYSLLSNSPVSIKEVIIELINKQKNSDYQISDYNRLMTEYYEFNIKTKN